MLEPYHIYKRQQADGPEQQHTHGGRHAGQECCRHEPLILKRVGAVLVAVCELQAQIQRDAQHQRYDSHLQDLESRYEQQRDKVYSQAGTGAVHRHYISQRQHSQL
jgi:hypothetical protein